MVFVASQVILNDLMNTRCLLDEEGVRTRLRNHDNPDYL